MKFLRNRKTGVVFPDHPKLRENKNMEPCNADGESAFETVDAPVAPAAPAEPAASANGIVLSKATKAEMIAFALENFGVRLEDSQTAAELREQVKTLIDDEA
ncbi:hypothetical protein [Marinobacter sp.]|uniref:hypothetical protein n=1 Tax=Marinobacter sp. TaxID=50741 RepID=UPI003A9295CC